MKIRITVQSNMEMGRLCYELGSRQITATFSDGTVCCPYDEALLHSLRTLGFHAEPIKEPKTPSAAQVHRTTSSASVTFTHTTTTVGSGMR